MPQRQCAACPEIIRDQNQSGYCHSCRHYARLYRENEIHEKRAEIRKHVTTALQAPGCTLCGRRNGRHESGCKWKPRSHGFYATRHVKRERNPITEYRCDGGHDFTSNLPQDKAICPFCHSRNIPQKGDSVQPAPFDTVFIMGKRTPDASPV